MSPANSQAQPVQSSTLQRIATGWPLAEVTGVLFEPIATIHLIERGQGRRIMHTGRVRAARLMQEGPRTGEFGAVNSNMPRAKLAVDNPAPVCQGASKAVRSPMRPKDPLEARDGAFPWQVRI